ncbi:Cof-type HAD-IIB family hydrolase [Halanaerobium hydrogeniformans]|uniref:Cof-like hydrolase n=1 Tax=Halanaerobium hydrogeniformans TaxID=656519 RepID=E4RN62_HALHG|nr:Cof-type HAD-IIB family hydrolase [Halanaerobium hydrogeniformans]ADQ14279.1 Cof-like hydrolase [Halanaerobium hydrogeniformans]
MNIKLISFDLDGTLLNDQHQLHEKTIEAVQAIRQKGIKTLIATGRMYISAKPYVNSLEMKDPVITYNGALVMNPLLDQEIYHSPIPLDIAKDISKRLKEGNYYLQTFLDDTLYVAEKNDFTLKYENIAGVEAQVVGDLTEFMDKGPTKMLIIEEDESVQIEIQNFLLDNFSDEIEITSSYPSFLEITKKGISKAVPLKKYAEENNLKKEEIMAFGDGLNDLKMIEWAGQGIAMENAHPGLREAADDIAQNNNQLGVARYLNDKFDLALEIEAEVEKEKN